jgi:hypothetical protein
VQERESEVTGDTLIKKKAIKKIVPPCSSFKGEQEES